MNEKSMQSMIKVVEDVCAAMNEQVITIRNQKIFACYQNSIDAHDFRQDDRNGFIRDFTRRTKIENCVRTTKDFDEFAMICESMMEEEGLPDIKFRPIN